MGADGHIIFYDKQKVDEYIDQHPEHWPGTYCMDSVLEWYEAVAMALEKEQAGKIHVLIFGRYGYTFGTENIAMGARMGGSYSIPKPWDAAIAPSLVPYMKKLTWVADPKRPLGPPQPYEWFKVSWFDSDIKQRPAFVGYECNFTVNGIPVYLCYSDTQDRDTWDNDYDMTRWLRDWCDANAVVAEQEVWT